MRSKIGVVPNWHGCHRRQWAPCHWRHLGDLLSFLVPFAPESQPSLKTNHPPPPNPMFNLCPEKECNLFVKIRHSSRSQPRRIKVMSAGCRRWHQGPKLGLTGRERCSLWGWRGEGLSLRQEMDLPGLEKGESQVQPRCRGRETAAGTRIGQMRERETVKN